MKLTIHFIDNRQPITLLDTTEARTQEGFLLVTSVDESTRPVLLQEWRFNLASVAYYLEETEVVIGQSKGSAQNHSGFCGIIRKGIALK